MTDADRMYKEVRFAFKQKTITRQEYRTLRGQLRKGDWEAAEKGFDTLMKRRIREQVQKPKKNH